MVTPATNLVQWLCERQDTQPQDAALCFQRDGARQTRTWGDVFHDVCLAVDALVRYGVRPGDRVAQLSENRYEWIVCDLACLASQAVHVPIHAPLAAPQIAYQVNHSGSRLLVVSTVEQQAKLASVVTDLPTHVPLLRLDAGDSALTDAWAARGPLADWSTELASADAWAGQCAVRAAAESLARGSLATILYTSGTTGQPKGVMLTQGNLVDNAASTADFFEMQPDERRLCFLPLSHIFARTCDLYTWLSLGHLLGLARTRETVVDDCQWFQPTIMSGVPYFYDRLQRRLRDEDREQQPGVLRDLLGGAVRYCCSGGAALPDHTFDYFQTQGVPLLQGYGLTETSPVISISTPAHVRRGAAGLALPGVEVAVASDGELVTRGPHVMSGYWQDAEATAQVLRDGWFHTGDLGHVDQDGFVYITGRKKELIVTAAGKNVAPVLLESLLTADPLIEQALVIGDGRNYLTALIYVQWTNAKERLPELQDVANLADACRHPAAIALIGQTITARLSGLSHHEQVRKFTLITRPFSLERQEITPKLSLRRPIIAEHFREEIERMYSA